MSHFTAEERLHIKEEPEMFSEGQEEKQLFVEQETNRADCSVKYEDENEEDKPQTSQLHWRQLTEMNIKEEPSTYSLNEVMTRQSVEMNSKGSEAAQNPDPNSLVLQDPDGMETHSSQTEYSSENDDGDSGCWQKPLSESETEDEADFDSTGEKTKMCDSSQSAKIVCKASKTYTSSLQHIFSEKVQVNMTSECAGGEKVSIGAASKLKNHTVEKPFQCDVCSKCFTQKYSLKVHMRIHTGEKPFKCDLCGECFTYKGYLQSHMGIHTGEKPFKCDVCSKCFNQKHYLQSHMRIHTGEKPFKCDMCSKCFSQKNSLHSHMRIHTGEKPFKCDICKKCFNQKLNLQVHTRIHTGEKPFKCDFCSKCFTQKASLLSHVKMHKGEKPFKCDVCSKCFTCKSTLQLHMRTHSVEKPFKCDVCNKCFSRKDCLQSHMRTHSEEKPFKCDVCNKCFSRKDCLQSHMRIHTGE